MGKMSYTWFYLIRQVIYVGQEEDWPEDWSLMVWQNMDMHYDVGVGSGREKGRKGGEGRKEGEGEEKRGGKWNTRGGRREKKGREKGEGRRKREGEGIKGRERGERRWRRQKGGGRRKGEGRTRMGRVKGENGEEEGRRKRVGMARERGRRREKGTSPAPPPLLLEVVVYTAAMSFTLGFWTCVHSLIESLGNAENYMIFVYHIWITLNNTSFLRPKIEIERSSKYIFLKNKCLENEIGCICYVLVNDCRSDASPVNNSDFVMGRNVQLRSRYRWRKHPISYDWNLPEVGTCSAQQNGKFWFTDPRIDQRP